MQYTVRHSAPPRDVFLTAGARAYQKHVLHGPETVSIFILLMATARESRRMATKKKK